MNEIETMSSMATRTLSGNESRIILELEWRGQKLLDLQSLRELSGSSDSYARVLAHQLVKKGWLERVRPGQYRLIPADRGREGVADTNPLAIGALLVQPYFFSYGTACTFHGLTEQTFAEVYIACQQSRHPAVIRGTKYVFAGVKPSRFFGFAEMNILGEKVQMADRERALLDALDRPRHAGGIGEVSRMVARSAHKVSWTVLVNYLKRWNQSALAQRLGYFLDLYGIEIQKKVRAELERLVKPESKVMLGARSKWGTSGRLVTPWNIIENVPREVLLERDLPRRSFVPKKKV